MTARDRAGYTRVASLSVVVIGLWTAPVWGASSGPRIVDYQGAPVAVRLPVSQAGAVEFPEEIADAFTVLTAEHIAIDYRANVLYLQLLQELDGTVFVATRSGASYTLAVATAANGTDVAVRIVPRGRRTHERVQATRSLTAVGLIRAMANGEIPPGIERAAAASQGPSASHEVYNDGQIALRLMEVYLAPTMRGYVVEAQNLTGASIPTPVQDLAIPGLQAVAAEQQLLYPHPRTLEEQLAAAHRCKMYLVVK
jgi:hypothetical protein